MRSWLVGLLAGLLGTSSILTAARCADPCWCGGFEAIGELLYLRPGFCDQNFAILDGRQLTPATVQGVIPDGKERGICFDYEPAFRLGAAYVFNDGCYDITFTYTAVWRRESATLTALPEGGGLWMMFGYPLYLGNRLQNADFAPDTADPPNAFASFCERVQYNMIDGVAATRRFQFCNLLLRRYLGIRWADIVVRRSATYEGTSVPSSGNFLAETHQVHSKSKTWGIGPVLGADFRWLLWCGISLTAHVSGAILAGEGSHLLQQHDESRVLAGDLTPFNQSGKVYSSTRARLFPEVEGKIGLSYLYCCRDLLSFQIEVGYEFISYINAMSDVFFTNSGAVGRDICESFNLDGVYVSITLAL